VTVNLVGLAMGRPAGVGDAAVDLKLGLTVQIIRLCNTERETNKGKCINYVQ